MIVQVLKECGYEEAVLGFSLSYNSTIERTKQILPKYAFGMPGENKFLESIVIWLDVTAPRYWWQEADTYRVGSTKQSESTMHTLTKRAITLDDFEGVFIDDTYIDSLNSLIALYRNNNLNGGLSTLKGALPEGFLQRRIWCINYKCLQNMYNQRKNHRLPQWHYFLDTVLSSIEHPEFIRKVVDGDKN